MTIRISKNRIFFRNFRHFQRRFSQRVLVQKSKPIPPFDSKFSADIENGVIFEKKQSRSRDIQRYVQHGKSGSYMTYRPQRVRQACRNSHFGRFYGFQHGNMPNITFLHVF